MGVDPRTDIETNLCVKGIGSRVYNVLIVLCSIVKIIWGDLILSFDKKEK